MADNNVKPPIENDVDKDKTLQILYKADQRISAIMASTEAANKSMAKFSKSFKDAADQVKLLNTQLSELRELSKNIKIPTIKVGNGGKAGSSAVSRTSEELKARLEIESKLKQMRADFGKNKIRNSEIDKIIRYTRNNLYKEHYAKFGVPNVESTEYEKKMTELRHAEALAASGTTAARRNAAKIYENYGMKDKADAIYKAVGGGSKATEFDMIDKFWGKFGLGRMAKGGEGTTSIKDAVGGIGDKLQTLIQTHPYTAMLLGIAGTLKLVKSGIDTLAEINKESSENEANYYIAARELMLDFTERDEEVFSQKQKELEQERQKKQANQSWGESWQDTFGGMGKNVSQGLKSASNYMWGNESDELAVVIAEYLKNVINSGIQTGMDYWTAYSMGAEIYNEAKLHSGNWLQNPSEMAENLMKAVQGDSKAAQQYGLVTNDTALKGWLATEYGIDAVNVEHSESWMQTQREAFIVYQLETLVKKGQNRLSELTKEFVKTGDVLEHFRNVLFSFDEVITLDAYDPDRGDYEAADTHILTAGDIKAIEEKEEPKLPDNVEEAGVKLPGNTLTTTPLNWLFKLFSPGDNTTDTETPTGTTSTPIGTVKVDPDTVKLSPTTVTLDTTDFNKGIELLRTIFNNFAYNILTLMNKLNNFGISTGTPGVGPTGDITTPITETPANQDDWRTLLYKQLEQDFLNRLANGGSGPSNQASDLKEWGFAWGGPGSASDILIDVTGDNNYIGNRRKMTESEAREWASANYYRFGPDEDGSTPARGVDIGNFYQPNSSSGSSENSSLLDMFSGLAYPNIKDSLWDMFLGISYPFRELYDLVVPDHQGGGHRFADGGIGTREIHNATLFEGNNKEAVIPLETPEGISYLSSALQEAGMASGGAGGAGGDSITINLTLTGLNISNNQADWQWVAQKIAEEIDVQRQRRGELNYGASY